MAKRKVGDEILQPKFDELERKNLESLLGGGEKRIEQQHAKGKLTAHERVLLLVDEGSFEELGKFVMPRCKDFGLDKEHYAARGNYRYGHQHFSFNARHHNGRRIHDHLQGKGTGKNRHGRNQSGLYNS